MTAVRRRTFSLPAEQSEFIDTMVTSGRYASGSEVVRAGLRALRERDDAVERWLREDVATTYDAMVADPDRALTAAELRAALDARGRRKAGPGS